MLSEKISWHEALSRQKSIVNHARRHNNWESVRYALPTANRSGEICRMVKWQVPDTPHYSYNAHRERDQLVKLLQWRYLSIWLLLTILRRETKKGNFIFIGLLFWPNCSCASYAGDFSVNTELAQKIRSTSQRRLDERFGASEIRNKIWGRRGGLFQCSTLLLHWSEQRRGNTTLYLHANTPCHAAHSHSHLRTCTEYSPVAKAKLAADWILCFWIWFIVNLRNAASSANHCAACLARWVWHFIHRILPSNG